MLYEIHKANPVKKDMWTTVQPAEINIFYRASSDYKPASSARLAYDNENIFVHMETNETDLRMEQKGLGFVHEDSCLEFFFRPEITSQKYLNFEFNPARGMYLSIGTSRFDREFVGEEDYLDLFSVRTQINVNGWILDYSIPLEFLKRFFPSMEYVPGAAMKGNFYKCGDKTRRPHYASWSLVDLPKPDFHRPEFFGDIVLS